MFPQAKIGFFVLGRIACLLMSALSLVVFLVVLARAARSALVEEFRVGSRTDVAYSPGTFSDRRVAVGLSGGVWSTDLKTVLPGSC